MNQKNLIIPPKKKVYVVSDLHLDHTNIIKYCDRPFNSSEEMNKVIVDNWNNTIQGGGIVYFLRDLTFGRGSRSTDYWLEKLN